MTQHPSRSSRIRGCIDDLTLAVLGRNSLSPSVVGMSLSYALNITQDFTYLIRSMCDVQFQMVSFERIDDYCNQSQEAPNFTDKKLPESWPSQGRVSSRITRPGTAKGWI